MTNELIFSGKVILVIILAICTIENDWRFPETVAPLEGSLASKKYIYICLFGTFDSLTDENMVQIY